MRILIDPGHGGADAGCQANGLVEKDINLMLGLMLSDVARAHGVSVSMTRVQDTTLSLSQRALQYAYDLVVAIHCDISTDPNVGGMRGYIKAKDPVGDTAAMAMLRQAQWPLVRNQRSVILTTSEGWTRRANNVLRLHASPALLAEVCFLSNLTDVKFLNSGFGKATIVNCLMASVFAAWEIASAKSSAAQGLAVATLP